MVHDLEGQEFVERVERFKAERRSFYLSPDRWNNSRVKIPLEWAEIKFEQGSKAQVPDNGGIYAFIVKHPNDHFPPHGFVMYIGITGERGKERTLRDRFGEYLYEKAKNKRVKLHFMLNKYKENLYFNYVALDAHDVDLSQLEIDLNDALVPPVGTKDFSAEIRQLRDALE